MLGSYALSSTLHLQSGFLRSNCVYRVQCCYHISQHRVHAAAGQRGRRLAVSGTSSRKRLNCSIPPLAVAKLKAGHSLRLAMPSRPKCRAVAPIRPWIFRLGVGYVCSEPDIAPGPVKQRRFETVSRLRKGYSVRSLRHPGREEPPGRQRRCRSRETAVLSARSCCRPCRKISKNGKEAVQERNE